MRTSSFLYEEWYSRYTGELVSENDPQLLHIKESLPLEKTISILDAGCGSGKYARTLLALGYQNIRSIDIVDPNDVAPPPNYTKASIENIPFDDQSFDVIYANSVIYHCGDQLGAMREFRRLLRPGGKLIISGHGVTSPATAIRKIKGLWGSASVAHLRNASFRRPGYYRDSLKALGFEDIRLDGFSRPWLLGRVRLALLRRFAKVLGMRPAQKAYQRARSQMAGILRAHLMYHFVIVATLPQDS